jgi:hypothetical protein
MLDHPDQDEVKKAGAEEGAGAAAGDAGDDENRDVQEGAGKPGAEKPAADKPGKEKQGTKAGPRAPPEGKSDDGTSKNEADGSDSRKSESSPEN